MLYRKKLVAAGAVLVAGLLLAACGGSGAGVAETPVEELSFSDSRVILNNPERGFYTPVYLVPEDNIYTAAKGEGESLVHLRVGLSKFTMPYQELDSAFLQVLNKTLDNYRQQGTSVIIRFAYDDFEGVSNQEPQMQEILAHVDQLAPIFESNQDVIIAVESGFLGRWGEQWGSFLVRTDEARRRTLPLLVDALLEVVPEPITVSVRTPAYYTYVAGIELKDLESHQAAEDDPYYRVGVFNDAYMSNEDDTGTYKYSRTVEVKWLNYQADHTLFGGEAFRGTSIDEVKYYDINYVAREMFHTHTSYLNEEYEEALLREWQNSVYRGEDEHYVGVDGLTYIENHLGYRFVLRSSEYNAESDELAFSVENVGAGGVLFEKKATLTLVGEDGQGTELVLWEIGDEDGTGTLDVREWKSGEISDVSVGLHDVTLSSGSYRVYLKIENSLGRSIQFANDNEFGDDGNWIGVVEVE